MVSLSNILLFLFFVQKIFKVPSTAEQMKIPFARVNHAKYMVTDRVVYIGMLLALQVYFLSACVYFSSFLCSFIHIKLSSQLSLVMTSI